MRASHSAAWATLGCDGLNVRMKSELVVAASTQAEVRAYRDASPTKRMCCNETADWLDDGTVHDYCPDKNTHPGCYTAITEAHYAATRAVDCDAAPKQSSVFNDGSAAVGALGRRGAPQRHRAPRRSAETGLRLYESL